MLVGGAEAAARGDVAARRGAPGAVAPLARSEARQAGAQVERALVVPAAAQWAARGGAGRSVPPVQVALRERTVRQERAAQRGLAEIPARAAVLERADRPLALEAMLGAAGSAPALAGRSAVPAAP